MSELRKALKASAEHKLELMVEKVRTEVAEIADGIEVAQLLRLALGGRIAALRAKIVADMVKQAEIEMVERYTADGQGKLSLRVLGGVAGKL